MFWGKKKKPLKCLKMWCCLLPKGQKGTRMIIWVESKMNSPEWPFWVLRSRLRKVCAKNTKYSETLNIIINVPSKNETLASC